MGNARRAPYGSSKAAKTKNSPPKRQKSPPPPPPPQKFHPKNLGPLPNVTPADDLTDIVALANVLVALTAYIAFARRIGVLSVASLPLIGAGAGVLYGGLMRVHFGLKPLPDWAVAQKRCVPVKKNADGVEPCSGLQVARNAVAAGDSLALPATYTNAGDIKTEAGNLKTWAKWSK